MQQIINKGGNMLYLGLAMAFVGLVLFVLANMYDEYDKRTNYERRFETRNSDFNNLFNRD